LSQLRIGIFRGPDWMKADKHTRDLLEAAASHLRTVVATVEDITPPRGFDHIAHHHKTIAGYEFARAITWERTHRQPLLSPKLLDGRCEDGLQCTYETYANAQAELALQRAVMYETMQNYDLLLTPSAPGEAWAGLEATGDPVFNTAWTALHMPALSIPAFEGATGLPTGLQLVGAFRQDEVLLAAAESINTGLGIDTIRASP